MQHLESRFRSPENKPSVGCDECFGYRGQSYKGRLGASGRGDFMGCLAV